MPKGREVVPRKMRQYVEARVQSPIEEFSLEVVLPTLSVINKKVSGEISHGKEADCSALDLSAI